MQNAAGSIPLKRPVVAFSQLLMVKSKCLKCIIKIIIYKSFQYLHSKKSFSYFKKKKLVSRIIFLKQEFFY
jgi:hypothetical protein